MTQNEAILNHLKSGKSITPIEALNKYGCFRLASRISDIKKMGYLVHKEMVNDKKPDGTKERYAKYMLVEY